MLAYYSTFYHPCCTSRLIIVPVFGKITDLEEHDGCILAFLHVYIEPTDYSIADIKSYKHLLKAIL